MLIGPRFVTPSDLLVLALWYLMTDGSATHCADIRADIIEERRAQRIQRGRDAARRMGRRVRPWEC